MVWIIDGSEEIAVDSNQLLARGRYIQQVTGSQVSKWYPVTLNGGVQSKFRYCISNDGIDGVFITAHIGDVYVLCNLNAVYKADFVVANTCIWEMMADKKILNSMRSKNQYIDLWFAKQDISVDRCNIVRQTTTLNNIGRFGFQTSLSERELFKHRKKGFMKAIELSFEHVYTIIL